MGTLSHYAETFTVQTRGRGTSDVTSTVQAIVSRAGVEHGQCTVFVHHTSASVIVCENADPAVRTDLEAFTARWVVDGDPLYEHSAEGPDDMPAHIRSIFTACSLTIPIADARADLGTWQGVYLWEHRTHAHRRRVTVTIIGAGQGESDG